MEEVAEVTTRKQVLGAKNNKRKKKQTNTNESNSRETKAYTTTDITSRILQPYSYIRYRIE